MKQLPRSHKTLTDDVEVSEKKSIYKGHFNVDNYRLRFTKFEEGWSNTIQRELVQGYRVVCVLLYDPDKHTVILVEQFRIGTLHSHHGPWQLEVVAGLVEDNEDILETLHRESEEEAGVTCADPIKLFEYWSTPGMTSERVHLYCARVDSSQASGIHGVAEEEEDIMVHVVDADDAIQATFDGQIDNAPSILALQWLQYNHQLLQQQWPSS